MNSIINLIIAHNYAIDDVDYDCLSKNPNPKIARLIMKHPNWYNIGSNPNIGLTKFIIKNKNKVILSQLRLNTNPGLAELIISYGYDKILCGNSNPGLTEFLKSQPKHELDYYLLGSNPNPALVPIMKYYNHDNPNPGLTDIILRQVPKAIMQIEEGDNPKLAEFAEFAELEIESNVSLLSENTNPKLAKLIIKHYYCLDWYEISRNSNPGLTEFIIDSLIKLDLITLAENRNPELTDFIQKHATAIDFSNTNKKLLRTKCPGGYLKKRLLSANPAAVYISSRFRLLQI